MIYPPFEQFPILTGSRITLRLTTHADAPYLVGITTWLRVPVKNIEPLRSLIKLMRITSPAIPFTGASMTMQRKHRLAVLVFIAASKKKQLKSVMF
jgi:hypothetical protein